MKLYFYLVVVLMFVSCKKEISKTEKIEITKKQDGLIVLGKELFEGKGKCFSCHKPDQKIVGPSIKEINTIYKTKKGNMVEFLKGNEEPIVDPSQFDIMKANFLITKEMTEEELKAIEAYFNSF